MGKYKAPSRRDVLISAGSSMLALSFTDVLFGGTALAATPKKGGKLTYASLYRNSKHKALKTAKHPYKGLHIRTKNVYNALTWVDQDIGVQPEVATKWEAVKDDQTVWEVDIREGIKFHDGRDLTVDDVVSSYNFHRSKSIWNDNVIKKKRTINRVSQ